MLSSRFSLVRTGNATESLITSPPAGIVTVGLPAKVSRCIVPGTASAPDSSPATDAVPTVSGEVPNALESRTRNREPSTLGDTTSRTV